jgi:peptidoglycan/xylan/chitin deacetylase (PgdA/CDA1 family)
MASLRDFSIKYLNILGRIIPARWLITSTNQKFILPFYHAVSDERQLHIQHLYRGKSIKEFVKDLEFLLRYFTPVDYIRFKELASSKSRTSRPFFLLSFDDGLREFHDIIAPILTKKGIPAVCFLNSAFIDNRDLFFKYKASVLISFLQENEKLRDKPDIKNWFVENSINDIQRWLLSIEYTDREKLDEFSSKIGYDFSVYLKSVQPYLTTSQIEKLIKDGFHFGAHSVDHPEYRFIPFEEQLKQTTESLQYVRSKFGLHYGLFSFPFTDRGISDKFFQTIISDKAFDLSFGAAGLKKESYPFHFQRIAFERGKLGARDIYKIECIYSVMQSIIGKNVIKRT